MLFFYEAELEKLCNMVIGLVVPYVHDLALQHRGFPGNYCKCLKHCLRKLCFRDNFPYQWEVCLPYSQFPAVFLLHNHKRRTPFFIFFFQLLYIIDQDQFIGYTSKLEKCVSIHEPAGCKKKRLYLVFVVLAHFFGTALYSSPSFLTFPSLIRTFRTCSIFSALTPISGCICPMVIGLELSRTTMKFLSRTAVFFM